MMELIFLKQYFRFCQSLNQQVFCFVCDPAHSCAGIFSCCCTLIAPSLHSSCTRSVVFLHLSLTTFGLPNQYALFQHDFSLLNRSKISIHNTYLVRGEYFRKRSINPTWLKMGKAFSCEVEVRSSTAARLRNPLPMSPLANVQVRGAATHRAPGRWLWQSRPSCTVEHWPWRPWACR